MLNGGLSELRHDIPLLMVQKGLNHKPRSEMASLRLAGLGLGTWSFLQKIEDMEKLWYSSVCNLG